MTPAPGMGADELDRVFEPFARGQAEAAVSTAHTASGTGLGLTIAKMLTDLMGGEMTVRSTPGEGTVFGVRLFLPEVHGVAPRRVAQPAFVGYEGARRRVLVVDNEESDRKLIARWLSPLGFEVMLATSGLDALHLLEAIGPMDAPARRKPSSWTWPCPASMAGRRCAGCARARLGGRCRWPSSRPMLLTRAWTMNSATAPMIFL